MIRGRERRERERWDVWGIVVVIQEVRRVPGESKVL